MTKNLLTPIFEEGLRDVHFFHGRLLTARDLRDEQEASRRRHRRLGCVVGDGVVKGLEVRVVNDGSDGLPVVTVGHGLAVNREGHVLELPRGEKVTLVRERQPIPPDAGLFATCRPPSTHRLGTSAGFYVLLMSPASGFSTERAPKSGLGADGEIVGCGSRYEVEGVQFRLERLAVEAEPELASVLGDLQSSDSPNTDPLAFSLLRNVLAHLFFRASAGAGTRTRIRSVEAPAFSSRPSPLDGMRDAKRSSNCDVPLAVLYWNRRGIGFLDNWTVRRLARWMPDPAEISLFSTHGLERLLQFSTQLEEVLRAPAGVEELRVEQVFRFLPPAAHLPVSGVGSAGGVRPSRFLDTFTTGVSDRLSAGQMAEALARSFLFPAVDLDSKAFLQVFRIDENEGAVADGAVDQLYQLYVSRGLNGPSSRDGVTEVFEAGWQVYRSLIRRRVFLPPGTDADKIAAQISMIAALRDVVEMANRQAARAAAWNLDHRAALTALAELHHYQEELVDLFRSPIPGIDDTQRREIFAREVRALLGPSEDGSPTLAAALAAEDLVAAVQAQRAINRFVGGWTGEGVASGTFRLRHLGSPDGPLLVPGESKRFRFELRNGTDKTVTFLLEARAVAPTGTWQGAVTLHRTDGGQISEVVLPSGKRSTLEVRIETPDDAEVGETATLELTATIPPPTARSESIELELEVAGEGGDPAPRTLRFIGVAQIPEGDLDNVDPSALLPYSFRLLYSALEGPGTASFDFTMNLTAEAPGSPEEWLAEIDNAEPQVPSPGVFRQRIQLDQGISKSVPVLIRAASIPGRRATFTVEAASVDLEPEFSAEQGEAFGIRVRPAS